MTAATSRTRQALAAIVGLLALVAAVVVVGPPPSGQPLDPDGVDPSGLRGLVEVLTELGVEVRVAAGIPTDPSSRVLIPRDRLDGPARDELLDWVEAGGTLVVADPTSALHGLVPVGGDQLVGRSAREPGCDLLDGVVGAVRQGAWEGLEVPADAEGCFPIGDGTGAWLVQQDRGAGRIIALGSPEPLLNARLGEADNAVLAAVLLGPAAGDQLRVVPPSMLDPTREDGLLALVSDRVWWLLGLLLVALLLAVLWQGRRDGPVVTERLPPVLPSAELARSLAGLLQRTDGRDGAADRLRGDARRLVRHALLLPPDTSDAALVAAVVDRGHLDADTARLALTAAPVENDRELLTVAAAVQQLRTALTGRGPHTNPPPTPGGRP